MARTNSPFSQFPRGLRRPLQDASQQVALAQVSAPGSIAARNNPMQYGTVAARALPGLFDPSTVQANQMQQQQQAQSLRAQQPAAPYDPYDDAVAAKYGLRARRAQQAQQQQQSFDVNAAMRPPFNPFDTGDDNGY